MFLYKVTNILNVPFEILIVPFIDELLTPAFETVTGELESGLTLIFSFNSFLTRVISSDETGTLNGSS